MARSGCGKTGTARRLAEMAAGDDILRGRTPLPNNRLPSSTPRPPRRPGSLDVMAGRWRLGAANAQSLLADSSDEEVPNVLQELWPTQRQPKRVTKGPGGTSEVDNPPSAPRGPKPSLTPASLAAAARAIREGLHVHAPELNVASKPASSSVKAINSDDDDEVPHWRQSRAASASAIGRQRPLPPKPPLVLGAVSAVCAALLDTLQVKHGLVLEEADVFPKLEAAMATPTTSRAAPRMHSVAAGDAMAVVCQLNARPDLQFWAHGASGARLVAVRVGARSLESFDALQQEVRRMPGTARTVAVIGASTDGLPCGPFRAVAVFRESYSRPHCVVGRCHQDSSTLPENKSAPSHSFPLFDVDAACFRSAIVLDPVVSSEFVCDRATGEGVKSLPPVVRMEYVGVMESQSLPTVTGGSLVDASNGVGGCGSSQSTLTGGLSEVHAEPTVAFMERLRAHLELPVAAGPKLLTWLCMLTAWLGGAAGSDAQLQAANSFQAARLHRGIVTFLARGGVNVSGDSNLVIDILAQVAKVIGLVIMQIPASRGTFVELGAVPAICGVTSTFPNASSVQQAAVFALPLLLEGRDTSAQDAMCLQAKQFAEEERWNAEMNYSRWLLCANEASSVGMATSLPTFFGGGGGHGGSVEAEMSTSQTWHVRPIFDAPPLLMPLELPAPPTIMPHYCAAWQQDSYTGAQIGCTAPWGLPPALQVNN